MMQDHYPETLAKTCIINAPFYFQAVWSLVKPLLQPRTVNKVTLLGTKYMDELLKYVDAENIPEYMGGKCRNTLLDDPGPWNDPQVLSTLGMIQEEQPGDASEVRPAGKKTHRKRAQQDPAVPPHAVCPQESLMASIHVAVFFHTSAIFPARLRVSLAGLMQGNSEPRGDGDGGSDLDVSLPHIPVTAGPDALEMSSASSGAVHSPAPLLRTSHVKRDSSDVSNSLSLFVVLQADSRHWSRLWQCRACQILAI